MGNDVHFIAKALKSEFGKVRVVPQNMEKYLSIIVGRLKECNVGYWRVNMDVERIKKQIVDTFVSRRVSGTCPVTSTLLNHRMQAGNVTGVSAEGRGCAHTISIFHMQTSLHWPASRSHCTVVSIEFVDVFPQLCPMLLQLPDFFLSTIDVFPCFCPIHVCNSLQLLLNDVARVAVLFDIRRRFTWGYDTESMLAGAEGRNENDIIGGGGGGRRWRGYLIDYASV